MSKKKDSHVICGLVVSKIYKHEFRLFLQNLSRICKMGITFAYELGLKSFLYEKSSTRKVTGLLRSRGKKIQKNSNLLVAHRLLGAPLVTEKKIGFEKKFEFFFKI